MRRRERLTVGRTTLTCLPLNVAAVPVLSWRTTRQRTVLLFQNLSRHSCLQVSTAEYGSVYLDKLEKFASIFFYMHGKDLFGMP